MASVDFIFGQFWFWLALGAGAIVFIYLFYRIREGVKERRHQREVDAVCRERDEDRARRRAAEEAAAEAHRRKLAAATLFGEPGESVAKAAARLGIEIRKRGEDEWLGRRADDAYRVKYPPQPSGATKQAQAVFYKIDPGERVEVERLIGLDHAELWGRLLRLREGDEVSGFKILKTGTEDISYDKQLYDGDFAHYVDVVDPIGRRLHLNDHGEANWVEPKWEW